MDNKGKQEFWRAVKFTLFSISAGVIQIGSFTLLNEVWHLPYWVSYLTALVLSVLWNFTLNRKITFKSANNVPIAMLKVAAYYAVFTPLSTMLEHYLTTSLGWNEYLVTGINMVINFVTEFLYQRFFVFGKSIDSAVKKNEEKTAEVEHDAISDADPDSPQKVITVKGTLKMLDMKCPQCGGKMTVSEDKNRAICGHCGNEALIYASEEHDA